MTHKQDAERELCEAAKNAEWIAERQRERAEKAEAALAAALAANRDCVGHFEQMKAELAALRERINESLQCYFTRTDTIDGRCAALHAIYEKPEWIGKRVRLVVEE